MKSSSIAIAVAVFIPMLIPAVLPVPKALAQRDLQAEIALCVSAELGREAGQQQYRPTGYEQHYFQKKRFCTELTMCASSVDLAWQHKSICEWYMPEVTNPAAFVRPAGAPRLPDCRTLTNKVYTTDCE